MNAVPRASGRAFLGLIRHVNETYGAGAFKAAAAQHMPAATQAVLGSRILHAHWYPYDAYVGVLSGLEAAFGEGRADYGRRLGMASGQRDINTVFKVYLAIASTERLIRSCSKVWASYYENAGTMEATAWAPSNTVLRITGFEAMAPQHCRLMEGWMISTMNALGVDVSDDASESACTSRGDAFHEFRCSWTKR